MKWMLLLVVLLLFLAGCEQAEFAEEEIVDMPEPTENLEKPAAEPIDKIFSIRAFQFGYDPDLLEVDHGDNVMITITSVDVGHGFALPDFGINERIPAEESVTVQFVADKKGEFEFFNSVYSGEGWEDMKGKFIVR